MDCSPPGSSLFMGFSRPEYWSGLPCPPPEDLPDPGIKLRSPTLQVDSLLSEPPGKPFEHLLGVILGVTGSWIRVRHEDEIKTQVLPSKGLFIS